MKTQTSRILLFAYNGLYFILCLFNEISVIHRREIKNLLLIKLLTLLSLRSFMIPGPGLGATNGEIFSNLRFLRKFEFFSPNCATKWMFSQTQTHPQVFSQIWNFSQTCVPPTIFQPHLRNKSWDFLDWNVETGN